MTLTLLSIFASSFMIALSGAMMPGPLLTVTISESTRRGAITGPLMIFGHGLLELLLVVALLSGFAAVLHRDDVFVGIALLGGATLFWMATSMLKNLSTLRLSHEAPREKQRNLVIAGVVLSVANPYWLIWWASIGLGYIMHSARFGILGVASFFVGHILADLMWYTLVSAGIARGRRLCSDTIYRRLIGSCAVFLLCFSCYFFYSGIEKLL
ncbi:MAG: LysE family transporter [Desulfobulbaceae bacterium]|nr:LysE family transporter [Desulfobulbaceae bacterium]